jgi:hypothetical protein
LFVSPWQVACIALPELVVIGFCKGHATAKNDGFLPVFIGFFDQNRLENFVANPADDRDV